MFGLCSRAVCALGLVACAWPAAAQETVSEAMDAIVARFYEDMTLQELYALDDAKVMSLLTPKEREVFATQHLTFEVDKPVIVSLFHNTDQAVVPFWMEEAGFTKTDMMVTNVEGWKYNVWQKEFPAGAIELGVNGLDYFRPHYLVSVGPQKAGDSVTISNLVPSKYPVVETKPGSHIYNDWSELVLDEVPEALIGQQLITSIRGRGRDAALVGAFRETPFPATIAPAPVYLTWSEDKTATSMTVQWRTSTSVDDGVVLYRERGSDAAFTVAEAAVRTMDDRMLANDRYCHWYRAVLTDLTPDMVYEYQVGSPSRGAYSALAEFATAPESPTPFAFFHLSDTHNNPRWGALMRETLERYPQSAFSVISGDLVGTGLVRDDWDQMLTYGQPTFQVRPVMPSKGNHDAQLGLGSAMYEDIFGLPANGPADLAPRNCYTFTYSNAQFFMLDVMSDAEPQAAWLEEQMKNSTATWKIAVFHFPLYSLGEGYPKLESLWGGLFDKYHLDLLLTGHIHHYMRTYPIRDGKVVESTKDGYIQVSSVCVPAGNRMVDSELIDVQHGGGLFVNLVSVDGNTLNYKAITLGGEIKDEFTIQK